MNTPRCDGSGVNWILVGGEMSTAEGYQVVGKGFHKFHKFHVKSLRMEALEAFLTVSNSVTSTNYS